MPMGKGNHPGTYGPTFQKHPRERLAYHGPPRDKPTDVGASKYTDPTMKAAAGRVMEKGELAARSQIRGVAGGPPKLHSSKSRLARDRSGRP